MRGQSGDAEASLRSCGARGEGEMDGRIGKEREKGIKERRRVKAKSCDKPTI